MRLIDADELKKTIINICGNCSNIIREYKEGVPDGNCAIQHIMNMIDNAPTVEPCYQTTSCLDCQMYDKENYNCPRFCEVIRSAIEERPQGEWIYKEGWNAYCSNCSVPTKRETNFCPNCGADMRGEENDT